MLSHLLWPKIFKLNCPNAVVYRIRAFTSVSIKSYSPLSLPIQVIYVCISSQVYGYGHTVEAHADEGEEYLSRGRWRSHRDRNDSSDGDAHEFVTIFID